MKHGFIEAVVTAFSLHYPLSLRPQHIWLLILQAVAEHINQNSEELRSKWVSHKGKMLLTLVRNDFVLGEKNNWAATVTNDEGESSFLQQIEQFTLPDAYETLTIPFSGSTTIEKVSFGIAIMDALKAYFDNRCWTLCGFPSITLEGTEEDWQLLRLHAEKLITERCTSSFAMFWLPMLLPILDKFLSEYHIAATATASNTETIDVQFWESMCKRGGSDGSGGTTWLNGWFNIFFPYFEDGRVNQYCVPYHPGLSYVQEGMDHCQEGGDEVLYSTGLSTAPVEWTYCNISIPLSFHSGFLCAKQDPITKTISPHIGWFIAKK